MTARLPAPAPARTRPPRAVRAATALAVVVLALSASGCSTLAARAVPEAPAEIAQPGEQPTAAPLAGEAATAPPPVTLPTPQPTAGAAQLTPGAPALTGQVRVFPGPRHFVGDVLSVEAEIVRAEQLDDPATATLAVDGQEVEAEPFIAWSPLRDDALVFRWAWDTRDVPPGTHKLSVSVPAPGGDPQTAKVLINLEAADERPAQEERARWAQRINNCCRISYVTGTAAERDIAQLDEAIDGAFDEVEARLGVIATDKPVSIVLLDNVWGNGAYVSGDVVISYVDRAYTSLDLETTLRHEAAHWTMRSVGAPETPALLSEGVAVYAAGGHFKPTPLPERAAALLDAGLYVPLADLADGFWAHQHETAYLEAAGLVAYLVETYGMQQFLAMYGASELESASPSEWLDRAFNGVFGAGLDEVEQGYREWLAGKVPGAQATDLELTIRLYDAVRHYQTLHAQYQEALPGAQDAIAAAQVAEYLREPSSVHNVGLEALLVAVQAMLEGGRYDDAQRLLDAAQATLDDGNFSREPVATYVHLAERAAQLGYEAQRITLEGDSRATVEAIRTWPQMQTLRFEYDGEQWQLVDDGDA